ncbi:uncharacterized protein C14orf119 homolog [Spea bombifrons]|uniref:uncharacterized protein C14orf119 homolog n=1 Tax=Spea bombifrons TaxID=233779 RepID=UPI002349BC89|nr:uncharacterized protein C14orf119 homolog [Spea bombifrons]
MTSEENNPISYIPAQEMRCVLHWFSGWSEGQRNRFMEDLLCKAVPGKLCLLLEGLGSLQLNAPPPSLFQCQMKLWDQWFQSWDEDERNEFLHRLEQHDPAFVAKFYHEVAGTAGKD